MVPSHIVGGFWAEQKKTCLTLGSKTERMIPKAVRSEVAPVILAMCAIDAAKLPFLRSNCFLNRYKVNPMM